MAAEAAADVDDDDDDTANAADTADTTNAADRHTSVVPSTSRISPTPAARSMEHGLRMLTRTHSPNHTGKQTVH